MNEGYDRRLADQLGEMHTQFADQYGVPCVCPVASNTADEIIAHCRTMGAVYHEDGPDDECFVVVLRPAIGPELWTERSLRRSRATIAAMYDGAGVPQP